MVQTQYENKADEKQSALIRYKKQILKEFYDLQ